MAKTLAAYAIGLLFGLGLTVAQMVNPAKVLNFLDVAGQWDPSLAFVMGGALVVTAIGYRIVLRRTSPALEAAFQLPTSTKIDGRLLVGAALFGIGWGLAGLCPGPAIAALSAGAGDVVVFAASMVTAMAIWRHLKSASLAA